MIRLSKPEKKLGEHFNLGSFTLLFFRLLVIVSYNYLQIYDKIDLKMEPTKCLTYHQLPTVEPIWLNFFFYNCS